VAQRHEHLAHRFPALVNVVPYDRDSAVIAVLIAQPLEDSFRGMVLLGRLTLILFQDPVDDAEEWIPLRPAPAVGSADILAAPKTSAFSPPSTDRSQNAGPLPAD
jgi:hypothetical protein